MLVILGDQHVKTGHSEQGKKGANRHAADEHKTDRVSSCGTRPGNQRERKVAGHGGNGGNGACLPEEFVGGVWLTSTGAATTPNDTPPCNGTGGNGGSNSVNAGTFDMSNTMSGVGQSAAGVMVISQNNGFSSLVQQSVNVQSNLAVGK